MKLFQVYNNGHRTDGERHEYGERQQEKGWWGSRISEPLAGGYGGTKTDLPQIEREIACPYNPI